MQVPAIGGLKTEYPQQQSQTGSSADSTTSRLFTSRVSLKSSTPSILLSSSSEITEAGFNKFKKLILKNKREKNWKEFFLDPLNYSNIGDFFSGNETIILNLLKQDWKSDLDLRKIASDLLQFYVENLCKSTPHFWSNLYLLQTSHGKAVSFILENILQQPFKDSETVNSKFIPFFEECTDNAQEFKEKNDLTHDPYDFIIMLAEKFAEENIAYVPRKTKKTVRFQIPEKTIRKVKVTANTQDSSESLKLLILAIAILATALFSKVININE